LLFIISIAGIASAEMVVNGPEQTSANIGDELIINGYVLLEEDIIGLLKFNLNCAGDSSALLVKSISLKAGEKKDFIEELAISYGKEGTCSVDVILESAGSIIDSKQSSTFIITSDLTGSFSLSLDTAQAGENIKVGGNVFEQNGDPVDGFGVVSLKKDGDIYFSDSFDVKNGIVGYTIDTSDIPGGKYEVNVEVRNVFGNFITGNAGKFTLISDIEVNAHTEKVHYLPSEKVKLTGTASVIEGKLKKGSAYITIDEESYEVNVKNGNFDLSIELAENIKSDKHQLNVRVEDDSGNVGTYSFSIIVDPIPTEVIVAVNKEAVVPGEKISIKAFLNDQGGDMIEGILVIKVVDDKGDVFYDTAKESGEQFDVALGDVVPGNYFIRASFGDLKGERLFTVGKVIKLEYEVDGQVLVVKNTGNVPYEGPLNIEMVGELKTSSISEEIKLKMGEEEEIDLGVGMITGTYKVTVDDRIFEDVVVVSSKKISYQWIAYAATLWLVLLLWFFWKKSKRRLKIKINKTLKKRGIKHPNRKHGEFGGVAVEKVRSDVIIDKPKKIRGLGSTQFKRKRDNSILSYISKFAKKKTQKKENTEGPISNVFSGVSSKWQRKDTSTIIKKDLKKKRKDKDSKKDPDSSWFNMFS
tara:strand:+ start:2833 stop:4752 length:1920 start_codon:yes stop_codon:yes gene_type:complete